MIADEEAENFKEDIENTDQNSSLNNKNNSEQNNQILKKSSKNLKEKSIETEKVLQSCEKYFSSELAKNAKSISSNEIKDISYNEYVIKDENLKFLCSPHIISLKSIDSSFVHHDYKCEYLLLRYLTDDEFHKNKLVKFQDLQYNKMNRYSNIIPYDYNTMYINNEKSDENYVNASYIISPPENIKFILAQNPLENTINSFWLMIIKNKISFIILFSYTFEESNDKYIVYWPKDGNNSITIENKSDKNETNATKTYKIVFNSTMNIIEKYFVKRMFDIYNDKDELILSVTQHHVNCWEEHSVPLQQIGFKVIDELISNIDDEFHEKNSYVLIHCSDGIGRSGTFMAIFNVIKCLMMQKKAKVNEPVYNIFNTVRKLREERYGMVTDAVQYKYIYDFCKQWVTKFYDV